MRHTPPGTIKEDTETAFTLDTDEKELLQRFRQEITFALENFSTTYGISDWKKCKPLEWRGFCLYVAETVFSDKSLLKEKLKTDSPSCISITNHNAYSIPLLSAIYDIYKTLCYVVSGLPCRVFDFAAFVGIPYQTFVKIAERVSTTGRDFTEKLRDEQENSIAMAGEGGRINVTMALAWNNHFHGWTQQREIIHRDGGAVLDSGSWKTRFLGESTGETGIIATQDAKLLPGGSAETT